jgi:hypothetical protein
MSLGHYSCSKVFAHISVYLQDITAVPKLFAHISVYLQDIIAVLTFSGTFQCIFRILQLFQSFRAHFSLSSGHYSSSNVFRAHFSLSSIFWTSVVYAETLQQLQQHTTRRNSESEVTQAFIKNQCSLMNLLYRAMWTMLSLRYETHCKLKQVLYFGSYFTLVYIDNATLVTETKHIITS